MKLFIIFKYLYNYCFTITTKIIHIFMYYEIRKSKSTFYKDKGKNIKFYLSIIVFHIQKKNYLNYCTLMLISLKLQIKYIYSIKKY